MCGKVTKWMDERSEQCNIYSFEVYLRRSDRVEWANIIAFEKI